MLVFLITATEKSGKRDTYLVEAKNAQDAFNIYKSSGFTEILLHDDDASALAVAQIIAKNNAKFYFSPADFVAFRRLTAFGEFLFILRKKFHHFLWLFILPSMICFFRWMKNSELILSDYVLMILPVFICFWVTYFPESQKYKKMLDAEYWGKWQTVLNLNPQQREIIPDDQLASHEACALAGLGRFDEAMELILPFNDDPKVPKWMLLSYLVKIYTIKKDYQQALVCQRLAYEAAPENPTVQIDYASVLLRYGIETELPRKLLDNAKQLHMSELLELFWFQTYGLLELKSRNYREAEENILIAQKGLGDWAASQPGIQCQFDFCQSFLAIVAAELGEKEKAEELYQQALPRLKALDEELIMNRYAEAIA